MKKTSVFSYGLIVVAVLVVQFAGQLQAQTFTVLHTFTNGEGGANPAVGVSIDEGGNLYGTTLHGSSYGTVFKLKHEGLGWILDVLLDFQLGSMGAYPSSRPYVAHDGTLYGTTQGGDGYGCGGGGCGVLYHLTPSPIIQRSAFAPWNETILYDFATLGAAGPQGDLLFNDSGNVYGTIQDGGACQFCGIVYELTPSQDGWEETILHEFQTNGEGNQPYGGVISDAAGNLYGVTHGGGTYGKGTIYELTPSGSGWTEQILHNFDPYGIDGYNPELRSGFARQISRKCGLFAAFLWQTFSAVETTCWREVDSNSRYAFCNPIIFSRFDRRMPSAVSQLRSTSVNNFLHRGLWKIV
jgi:uncharacterized repeat protein (TIGR03803 family)